VDRQPAVDGEHAGVERDIMGCARGQAVARIEALTLGAVFPRRDVPGQQELLAAGRRGEAAEHAPVAAVGQHVAGEDVLTDPHGRQQDPLGLPLLLGARRAASGELVAQLRPKRRHVELLLAEQGQLPAVLQAKEVGNGTSSLGWLLSPARATRTPARCCQPPNGAAGS
jgi:hypothetical protein